MMKYLSQVSLKCPQIKANSCLSPEELGFSRVSQEALYGGGHPPEEAAQIFRNVLNCRATDAQMNAVLVNAAFGIQTIEQERPIGGSVYKWPKIHCMGKRH